MIDKQPQRQRTPSCRICLIRHGETAWNAERRLQGHLDLPLNETGLAQAEAAARHLADEPFAALYSSDLLRTRQTATPLARGLGREMIREPRLRERHYGHFQGLTYEEAAAVTVPTTSVGRYRGGSTSGLRPIATMRSVIQRLALSSYTSPKMAAMSMSAL